jgi:hypothetical protein
LKNRVNVTLGCFTLVVIVAIFSIEGILTLLRQRNISVTLEVHSLNPAATAAVVATPTAAPSSTPDAKLAVLTITPDTIILVHAKWDYRIGPRFPDTVVRATVTDTTTGKVVASDENTILCGPETIQCNGEYQLSLAYGVNGKTGSRTDWPVGSYTVVVTSSIADLKPTDLLRQSFTVKAAT